VSQHGIAAAVTFAGAIPFDETPSFYRTADVFALPSSFDNSPNAVLEAMASGLPVVATAGGGAAEFVSAPAGGAIVADDAAALAASIERFLSPAVGAAAGDHNRRRAVASFSWRTSALRLRDVYERVIAARRGVERVSA